jgi:hypothetical protein
VSKSVWSILGIGAAGLVMLALMMQHLAEAVVERERSPYAAAVETRAGSKLVGRVRIAKLYPPDATGAKTSFSFDVLATVAPGVDKQRLAEVMGQEVWLGSMRAGERADAVTVRLYEADEDVGGVAFRIAPPGAGR